MSNRKAENKVLKSKYLPQKYKTTYSEDLKQIKREREKNLNKFKNSVEDISENDLTILFAFS